MFEIGAFLDTLQPMRILLVEDDRALHEQVRAALSVAGYAVDGADNGADAYFLGDTETYDAVILDLGLAQIDGITVLKRWRDAGNATPVLVLTARDNWSDKVTGIDAGADDYLTKPFHMEELLARVRALIRRAAGHSNPLLRCGELCLDTRAGRVTVGGQPVLLTSHEFKVLEYLMHRPGAVISRTELIEHIYARDFDRDSNTIEVFVARLRKKLPSDLIETVRGFGYRLIAP